MKIVVYGASVTAQKGESGYFERLAEYKPNEIELIRIPYGASHLHFAGIAMLQKVLDEQPDVCILDWVTPSTKVFPQGIVERINNILLSNNIRPIWLLFPRTDDPNSERQCCNQIYATESDNVTVRAFQNSNFHEENLSTILRDVVHTNSVGAERYAQFALEVIKNIKLEASKERQPLQAPPIVQIGQRISAQSSIAIDISVAKETDVTAYLYAKIGPKSPVIEVSLYDKFGNKCVLEKNVTDPWCYYERDMLLNFPTFKKVEEGDYQLKFRLKNVNPFDSIKTLKPIDEDSMKIENNERFLDVNEASIDGSVLIKGIQHGL